MRLALHTLPMLSLAAAAMLLPADLSAEAGATVIDNGAFEKFSGARRATKWSYGRGWRAAEGVGVDGSRALVYANDDPAAATSPRQLVDVECGRAYMIAADIFIEGTLAGPEGAGACVQVEWLDAQGNVVGGVRTEPLASTGGAWRHVSAISKPVPKETVRGRVSLLSAKGGTGRAVFDNVALGRWYRPRLLRFDVRETDVSTDEPQLEMVAELDLSDVGTGYSGVFVWRGSDGRSHRTPPATMDSSLARLVIPSRRIARGASRLAFVLMKPNGEVDAHLETTFGTDGKGGAAGR